MDEAGSGPAVGEVSHMETRGGRAGWVQVEKTRWKVRNWRNSRYLTILDRDIGAKFQVWKQKKG